MNKSCGSTKRLRTVHEKTHVQYRTCLICAIEETPYTTRLPQRLPGRCETLKERIYGSFERIYGSFPNKKIKDCT